MPVQANLSGYGYSVPPQAAALARSGAERAAWWNWALGAALGLTLLLLMLPVFLARPGPLSSDESLYLSEAYNIAEGLGPRYTSGELINHRAPLFSAVLALPISITDNPQAAYIVPKLLVIALAVAVFLVAAQAFGPLAGVLASLLVASNAFFRWLGATLFLDGMATLFLLLFLWSLARAFQAQSSVRFAYAGVFLGLAFLTKETAILWLPLPLAFVLLSEEHRCVRSFRGLAAYGITTGALLAVWWLWVYLAAGRVYLWGEPDRALLFSLLLVLGSVALAGLGAVVVTKLVPHRAGVLAKAAGIALVVIWSALLLLFLELTSWSFPREHWSTVPRYLWSVAAPNTQPWPLVALGVAWLGWRSWKDPAARLLALALALFVPLALWIGNRDLAYRNLLPMAYIAYVGAGAVAARALQQAAERSSAFVWVVATLGLAVVALVQTHELQKQSLSYDNLAVDQSSWDNPLVHDSAAWLGENVPPGAGVMSSRLYFSHLYVLDRAAHPIYQLPTVRVEPEGGGTLRLRPMTTLFRWEDHRLAGHDQVDWIYLHRYPKKGYYIGLSEQDLLGDLRERSVEFLVLTGKDAGFSSFAYIDYFLEHPAFELVHVDLRDDRNGVYIFRVHRDRIATRPYQAVVTPEALAGLGAEMPGLSLEQLKRAIDADGAVVRSAGETAG